METTIQCESKAESTHIASDLEIATCVPLPTDSSDDELCPNDRKVWYRLDPPHRE